MRSIEIFGRDASGSGALLLAANDIDITSAADLMLDAHQNRRFLHLSSWTVGISFGGSGVVESLLAGADGGEFGRC